MRYALLLTLVLIATASAMEWNLHSNEIVINTTVTGSVATTNPSAVEFLNVSIQFFPTSTPYQKLLEQRALPENAVHLHTNQSVQFYFTNLRQYEEYSIQSLVQRSAAFTPIHEKIPFPITTLPTEIKQYMLPSDTIDSDNPTVIEVSQRLAERHNDLYKVVSEIGMWVSENIEYNLSTRSAEATYPSSWVLENRYGVCGEITNLFIGLLRAQGIPSRFMSGIAYSDAPYLDQPWGAHGWAEVYFPNIGWVPYDVTYQQYGYVDPTHITFSESLDAVSDSSLFQWRDNGATLDFAPLQTTTSIVSYDGAIQDMIDVDIKMYAERVGIGSYNRITATVTNRMNSYLTSSLQLGRVNHIEHISDTRQTIILEPREKKEVTWIIKVSDEIDSGFLYTIPIVVASPYMKEPVQDTFQVDGYSQRYPQITFQEDLRRETTTQASCLQLTCQDNATKVQLAGTDINVACTIRNTCEEDKQNIQICQDEDTCRSINVREGESTAVSFTTTLQEIGAEVLVFRLMHGDIETHSIVTVPVSDMPHIAIQELKYPANADYRGTANITFTALRTSHAIPYAVSIQIFSPQFSRSINLREINIEKIDSSYAFNLAIPGSSFNHGQNNVTILLAYEDELGRRYTTRETITINLDDINLMQWFTLKFRRSVDWFVGLF